MPDAAPVTSAVCPFSGCGMSPSSVASWTRSRAATIPNDSAAPATDFEEIAKLDPQPLGQLDLVSFHHELVRPTVGGEIDATGRAPGEMHFEFRQHRSAQFAVEVFHESLDRVLARHARTLSASRASKRRRREEVRLWLRELTRQLLAERHARPVEPRFDRRHGVAENLSDLLVREVFHVAKDEDGAV